MELPDGTHVLARGRRRDAPPDPPPDFGLYLGSRRDRRRAPPVPWAHAWLDWPDFRRPRDPDAARTAITELHRRVRAGERVEVACGGGIGRTGTVLACLVRLAGVDDPDEAIAWVRAHHHRRAVETRGQRRWVAEFPAR